jgi:hemolysin III
MMDELTELMHVVKPKLRGWLHAATFPVAVTGGIVLVAFAPTTKARIAAALYGLTASLLFGISALYHRGSWSPRALAVLKRLDHANIYLIIAGTYTPMTLLCLHGAWRVTVLAVIWGGAVAGVLFRVLWVHAPRWLYTALYVALGWVAVFGLPQFLHGAGLAAFVLIIVGGLLYSLGGLVYGLRRPNPSPRWFGFHEIFHALTVAAFTAQYVAVSLVTYRAA